MLNPLTLLKTLALACSIAFITPLVIYQGIKTLYPLPSTLSLNNEQSIDKADLETTPAAKLLHDYYTQFFLLQVIISCLIILISFFSKIDFLATGWIIGGILTVISGLLFHWQHLSSTVLFIVLLLFLCFIISVGYYSERKS